jgi:hypothetical protein
MAVYPGLDYQGPTFSTKVFFMLGSTQIGGYNRAEWEFGRGLLGAILRLVKGGVLPSE